MPKTEAQKAQAREYAKRRYWSEGTRTLFESLDRLGLLFHSWPLAEAKGGAA